MSGHTKYERFVQRFCTWADSAGYPFRVRRILPGALRKLAAHLSDRDRYVEIVVRALPLNHKISICAESVDAWVYSTESKVVLGAVYPSWKGVRSITKSPEVNDLLSDFAFLGAQYVARSRIARAQFALSISAECAYDFRGANEMIVLTKERQHVIAGRKEAEARYPKSKILSKARSRQAQFWISNVNALDPFVHRIIYQYWRAVSLFDDGYFEDSIGCLDSIISVCAEALHHWRLSPDQPTRIKAAVLLGLSVDDQRTASELYSLRCGFSSHPPLSKWWDFCEIYEERFGDYFDFVARAVKKICLLEKAHRIIEPLPESWSEWLLENAEMIFDVVWFSRLPRPVLQLEY